MNYRKYLLLLIVATILLVTTVTTYAEESGCSNNESDYNFYDWTMDGNKEWTTTGTVLWNNSMAWLRNGNDNIKISYNGSSNAEIQTLIMHVWHANDATGGNFGWGNGSATGPWWRDDAQGANDLSSYDGSWHTMGTTAHATWEKWQVTANLTSDTFDFYLNDTLIDSGDNFRAAITVFNFLEIQTNTDGNDIKVANISIFNGTSCPTGAPPTPTVNNFSILTTNANVFNATVDGVYYNTTTGKIVTGVLDNLTKLINITLEAKNFFNKEFLDYNVSVNISTTMIAYPQIRVWNRWDGGILDGYALVINGTSYSPDSSNITHVPYNTSMNVSISKDFYYNTSYIIALAADGLFNISDLYQSLTYIWAKAIRTSELIMNFTVNFPINGSTNVTNYYATLYPNRGNYTFNFTSSLGYVGVNDIAIEVNEIWENLTITGLYARNISFVNNRSVGQTVTPNCTQSGYVYDSYDYLMPSDTGQMHCSATGFRDINFTLGTMPDTGTYQLLPAFLWLIFSENTTGYVETENCTAQTNNCDWFNATNVYIEQYNISEGRVVVKFNPDGSGNWQQIFEYNNDNETHVKEYIHIFTPDLVQNIKVTSDGTPIDNARVVVKMTAPNPETNVTDWITVYADFTTVDGISTVLINDENTYKFCAQKENYTTTCIIDFIPPANADTILIDMEPVTSEIGFDFVATSCPSAYFGDHNCTLEINTYKSYNTICVNYTDDSTNTQTCDSDSVSKSYSYILNSTTGNVSIAVFFDGTMITNITNLWIPYDPTVKVSIDVHNDTGGFTLYERVQQDKEYLVAMHIILIIIGIFLGFMAEKYFNGYGVYGSGLWFLFMGIMGLAVYYIPAIMVGIYAIIEGLVPLFKNK